MLGMIVFTSKWRRHDTVAKNQDCHSLHTKTKNHPTVVTDAMSLTTTGGEVTAVTGSWQAAVDAELKKPPSDDTAVKVWQLRCKEATMSALEGM